MVHTDGAAADVLVAGAGPVGLTAAAELRRRGIACRIVDRLPARLPYAKAVGIQPRTLEIWDRMGFVQTALEAAVPMRGQLTYVNGVEQPRLDLVLAPEVPYGFAALPQYETERIIEEFLERFGTRIERGTELVSFVQDADGVTSRLTTPHGEEEVRTRFLVGCDGAHSIVRKGLGLTFEGGAFPEEYMLADVEVDWDLPYAYGVRAMHHDASGAVDDVLVCIPLPGDRRYRVSMMVPPELSAAPPEGGDGVVHGLEGSRPPELAHVQAALDRLSPQPTTASAMRWSSVFRISHRLVDRYGHGRVFVAGDAAHIHPPTGAQGMNTGIQDAWNLAWKLALAVEGAAAPGLVASYDAERRPVGEEVVGRTVRHAAEGVQADPEDAQTLMQRQAQLLVGYRGSPVVQRADAGAGDGPQPGDRAPDCGGLTGDIAAYSLRLYDLLRGREHVLLLYGPGPALDGLAELTSAVRGFATGRVGVCAILTDTEADRPAPVPVYRDGRGEFARLYGVREPAAFVVRPDGYLGARLCPPTAAGLLAHFSAVFAG
ncbi:FAD-dependent monooxygenase [Streptomyces sp. KS 21]|uniref:FAD-dependent monooxygenase n=1 Tax=Streptomyces sp. KS 21 TaxID=2485150 RepID=UPI00106435F1|nr:FAD-dependent monooxygenase [Streptomyces sp. KS 21]TDU74158.1 2-polyprenyl-6-methoxyphenol hydroxylase-like FAD-dependent oxidoreductase [Streptomyces sp. KS 21]